MSDLQVDESLLQAKQQVGVEFEFVSVNEVTDPMDSVPNCNSEGSAAAAAAVLLELELLGSTDSNIDW